MRPKDKRRRKGRKSSYPCPQCPNGHVTWDRTMYVWICAVCGGIDRRRSRYDPR